MLKFIKSFLLLVVAISSFYLQAQQAARRWDFKDKTMLMPNKLPKGFEKWAGKEVSLDTSAQRSIILLSDQEAIDHGVDEDLVRGLKPEQKIMANFRHDGQFWIAIVDVSKVFTAMFQQDVFLKGKVTGMTMAAHGQIRYLFDEGAIQLFPQENNQAPYRGDPLTDIIISAEAVRPDIEGFPSYDLIGGLRGHYRQSMRVMSTKEKAAQMFEAKHEVKQFLMKFRHEDLKQLLWDSLRRSDQMGVDVDYHTLGLNKGTQCVYECFMLIDGVKYQTHGGLGFLLDQTIGRLEKLPIVVGTYLQLRNLRFLTPSLRSHPTLNEEIDSLNPNYEVGKQRAEANYKLLREKYVYEPFSCQTVIM